MAYQSSFRVYYEDTDASGVMYHARYLAFFERARSDILTGHGLSQQRLMEEHNIAFTLATVQATYKRPARLDDEVLIETQLKPGRALVEFSQTMKKVENSELLATLEVKAGCVRTPDFRPTRLPLEVAESLTKAIS